MKEADKTVLLGASQSVIEPLGLLHLAGVAKQEGYKPKIRLFKGGDFSPIDQAVKEFNPGFLGLTVYTGNHIPIFSYLDQLRQRHPEIPVSVLIGATTKRSKRKIKAPISAMKTKSFALNLFSIPKNI